MWSSSKVMWIGTDKQKLVQPQSDPYCKTKWKTQREERGTNENEELIHSSAIHSRQTFRWYLREPCQQSFLSHHKLSSTRILLLSRVQGMIYLKRNCIELPQMNVKCKNNLSPFSRRHQRQRRWDGRGKGRCAETWAGAQAGRLHRWGEWKPESHQ